MPAPRFAASSALPFLAVCLLWPAADAAAQQQQQQAPHKIGEFQSWTAATHTEGGQKICYAFTRATRSEGVPNRAANNVLLVVTNRPKGRDQVALQAGYAYPRNSGGGEDPVQLSVGGTKIGFYTSGSSAFARDNKAALAALKGGREAVARGPVPNGRGQATDAFSLAGFGAAHEAISRECPAASSAPAGRAGSRR